MKLKTKVSKSDDGKPVIVLEGGAITGTLHAPEIAIGQVVEVTIAEIVAEGAVPAVQPPPAPSA